MATYHCPLEIIDLFETEELAAEKGRQAVLDWLANLELDPGDEVVIPMGPDGEPEIWCYDPGANN